MFDTDPTRLAGLFLGRFDRVRCEAGCVLNVRPSVVFVSRDRSLVWVVHGDLVDREAAQDQLAEIMAETHAAVLDDLDALRRKVGELLVERTKVVAQLSSASHQELVGFLTERWRELTPEVFAAVRVAMTGQLPGMRIYLPDADASDPDAAFQPFAQLQAQTWLALCYDWLYGDGVGTMEADLARYVDQAPIMRGAAREFDRIADSFADGDAHRFGATGLYAFDAVQASVYDRIGQPRPGPDGWAYTWLLYEYAQRTSNPGLPADRLYGMRVAIDRARRTISRDSALQAAAMLVNQVVSNAGDIAGTIAVIGQAFTDLGHSDLEEVLLHGVHLGIPLDQLADAIIEQLGDVDDWLRLVSAFARPLVGEHRVDDLVRIADAFGARGERDRALADAWLSRQFLAMNMPRRVLERLGDTPPPYEKELPGWLQCELLINRVTALRMLSHRSDEALRLLEHAETVLPVGDSLRIQLGVLKAQVWRQSGKPAAALALLEDLYQGTDEPTPPLLEALAATLARFGRFREASQYARRAYQTAAGSRTLWPVERLAAEAMVFQALAGDTPDADLVEEVTRADPRRSPRSALSGALALLHSAEETHTPRPFVVRAVAAVPHIVASAIDGGDHHLACVALYVAAHFDQRHRPEHALASWQRLAVTMADKFGLNVQAECLLYLVACSLRDGGEWADARDLLHMALRSQIWPAQDVASLGAAAGTGSNTRAAVDAATAAALDTAGYSCGDLRVIAELRRGVVGPWLASRGNAPGLATPRMIDDADVAVLAPGYGRVGVLEWVTDGRRILAMVTTIDSSGGVGTEIVPAPAVDLPALDRRLRYRLASWTPGRPGDAFGLSDWYTCRDWLTRTMADCLAPGDHLVIIPLEGMSRLPWHVAAPDEWTCSYETSWAALLDIVSRPPPQPPPQYEGIVVVPRSGDPPAVTEAMDEMACRTHAQWPLTVRYGAECDREAVRELLESVDVLTVLAHGYVGSLEVM